MPGHEGAGATVQKRWGEAGGGERGCQYTPFLLLIVAVILHTFKHEGGGGGKIEKSKCSPQSGDKLFFILYCNHCNHTLRMRFVILVCMRIPIQMWGQFRTTIITVNEKADTDI